ncbi:kinase-like domain-containing protein [Glomus cerebriforme]|uniref:Kinase-like domain-containing protein n=1 Tax=Glomus cerebriforme TaxID=658196 RepID=A0A397SIX2_9GLOM|nr:kinase-like domain-containing protein [Glomus cerebriforme]
MSNFVHRDFHSGNILFDENSSWKIGDLGLSQPVNNTSNNEIYGVIPYIAPEIFKGFAFSKESDVYCRERPKITEDTPECFANLIKSCWDPDPKKIPSIGQICNNFDSWNTFNRWYKKNDQVELKEIE